MKINNRLKKIGDLVAPNSICLDVGCDHALLDIYLVKKKQNIKAVASDVKEGPLDAARENIKREKLEEKIEVRLGNGLDTYKNEDTVIISGMGGRNIIGICKNGLSKLKNVETLILSPNNYQVDVKKFITKNGFYIDNEVFIKEGKFIYQIIVLKKGKRRYKESELFFGPIFLQNKDDKLFKEYYKRELSSKEIILKLLPKNFWFKKILLKRDIRMIKKVLI